MAKVLVCGYIHIVCGTLTTSKQETLTQRSRNAGDDDTSITQHWSCVFAGSVRGNHRTLHFNGQIKICPGYDSI